MVPALQELFEAAACCRIETSYRTKFLTSAAAKSTGYFPLRIVEPLIAEKRVHLVKRARRFVYPVYAAYPEERDAEAYAPILDGLREMAATIAGK